MTQKLSSSRPHKSLWRRLFQLAILALVVVGIAWGVTLVVAPGGEKQAASPLPTTPELIKKGEYLARAGDCAACHTNKNEAAFSGGYAFNTPIGTMYSSNITPDKNTGIGTYSYGEFERAVRRGVSKNGTTLYPAMPYPSYSILTDDDVAALYAYFMNAVAPVDRKNNTNSIPWPLSLRWPVTYWRWLFSPAPKVFSAEAYPDPVLARGAYLVEGLGHCGACHTPRAITLEEEALNNKNPVYLSGNFMAPSLRGENLSGLASLSESDIIDLLRTGRSQNLAIYGEMRDVVHLSMQYMEEGDLAAIAKYLKSLPANKQEPAYVYNNRVGEQLKAGVVKTTGQQLYIDNCAACHLSTGKGYSLTFPMLAGNPTLNGNYPDNVIKVVLTGGAMPQTKTAPTQFAMPSFAWRLSDEDVAEVVNFIRTSWGNTGSTVTAADVKKVRSSLPKNELNYTNYDPRR